MCAPRNDSGKRSNLSPALLAALLIAVVSGCDGLGSSGPAPDVVLEAYYISGQPLGAIRLSRTESIDAVYDPAALVIPGAAVRVELLDGSGAEAVYGYVYDGSSRYVALDETVVVMAGRTYRLTAELPDGELVSAETTVPGAFEVQSVSASSVVYQSEDQYSIRVTRSTVAGRQAIFVFSIESEDPRPERLTPFYREFFDESDDLNALRVTESPPINEQNYDFNPDGTLTIKLPWLAVAFYGVNNVIANSIDNNLYDFLRSHIAQQGGSTLAPGEIPNVIDHVQGGTGVFGSFSRVTTTVEILRNPAIDP